MNILSKPAERLTELMAEAELSVPALSAKVDIEQSAILRLKKAERLPSTSSLVKLADYFRCTCDYLLGRSDVLDERQFKQRPPFYEQLTFLLGYFHISQYRLVKILKIAEQTVINWRKGKYEPNVENLIKLSKSLHCSVDFILGREK